MEKKSKNSTPKESPNKTYTVGAEEEEDVRLQLEEALAKFTRPAKVVGEFSEGGKEYIVHEFGSEEDVLGFLKALKKEKKEDPLPKPLRDKLDDPNYVFSGPDKKELMARFREGKLSCWEFFFMDRFYHPPKKEGEYPIPAPPDKPCTFCRRLSPIRLLYVIDWSPEKVYCFDCALKAEDLVYKRTKEEDPELKLPTSKFAVENHEAMLKPAQYHFEKARKEIFAHNIGSPGVEKMNNVYKARRYNGNKRY